MDNAKYLGEEEEDGNLGLGHIYVRQRINRNNMSNPRLIRLHSSWGYNYNTARELGRRVTLGWQFGGDLLSMVA